MNTDAVIIIPAYNPTEKFVALMRGVSAAFKYIIVVNDGSKSECDEIFATIKTENPCVTFIDHEVNMGKGAALKTAFSHYKNSPVYEETYGFVTADCDGQHTVEDMLMLAGELAAEHDRTLHMGSRDLNSPDMPPRSKAGNKITAFMFRYLYGVKLRDTQSGLRAFSKDLTDWLLDVKGDRFEYEMNVLIKSKDGGVHIAEHTVATLYEKNHTSHFRSFKDSWRVMSTLMAGLTHFLIAAIAAAAFDLGLFSLFDYVILDGKLSPSLVILISTVVSRAVSSIVNFMVNRFLTFGGKRISKASLFRYYTLWLVQMLASYGAVYGLSTLFGGGDVVVKLFVDLILSLMSYKIQQVWVFRKKHEKKKKTD